jgi:hypothetical protein
LYERGTIENSCQPSTAYRAWSFAVLPNGTVRLPTAGLSKTGNYQLQMFRANTYCHIGESEGIVLEASGSTDAPSPALTVQTSNVKQGSNLTIRYMTGTGESRDWIGIFPAGKLNRNCESTGNYLDWQYTNGSAGSLTFTAPAVGSYVAQLFSNNSYCHIGEQVTFTVTESSDDSSNNNSDDSNNQDQSPPRLSEIFQPLSEHFAAPQGKVRVLNLGAADAICVAADGVQPSWNRGRCAGDGVQRISNPSDDFTLTLTCNGQTGTKVPHPLKLVFNWPDGKVHLAQANFQLTCDNTQDQTPDNDAPTLTSTRDRYSADESVVLSYQGGSGSNRDWVGIFRSGQLNRSCAETERYVTWVYTNGTGGTASFEDIPTGVYQAQLFEDNSYCHLGDAITFTIVSGNDDNNGGGDNNGTD